jgi:hypothetical protein
VVYLEQLETLVHKVLLEPKDFQGIQDQLVQLVIEAAQVQVVYLAEQVVQGILDHKVFLVIQV